MCDVLTGLPLATALMRSLTLCTCETSAFALTGSTFNMASSLILKQETVECMRGSVRHF